MVREIVTVQFGAQANYVASHYWNAQESYFTYASGDSPVNHDVQFRAGLGSDGSETFLPRTVVYDFKTNYGALRKYNELYQVVGADDHAALWHKTATYSLPQAQQSDYQLALEQGQQPQITDKSSVRYWSDYLHVYYHPRSFSPVYDADLEPTMRTFADWSAGVELYSSLSAEEDLVDRDFRPFAEECDNMQAIQFMTAAGSGWTSFAAYYFERLLEDYGKVDTIIWDLDESRRTSAAATVIRARSICAFAEASLLIPLVNNDSSLHMDSNHLWHTSGLQAAAIESTLLPTRLQAPGSVATVGEVVNMLGGHGKRNIAQLSFGVEATAESNGVDVSASCEMLNLFPSRRQEEASTHVFGQFLCARSLDPSRMILTEPYDGHHHQRSTVLEMPLLSSFPPIFPVAKHQKSVATKSVLQTTSVVGTWLKDIERHGRRLIPIDEREQISDELRNVSNEYIHFESSDGDYDWDD